MGAEDGSTRSIKEVQVTGAMVRNTVKKGTSKRYVHKGHVGGLSVGEKEGKKGGVIGRRSGEEQPRRGVGRTEASMWLKKKTKKTHKPPRRKHARKEPCRNDTLIAGEEERKGEKVKVLGGDTPQGSNKKKDYGK